MTRFNSYVLSSLSIQSVLFLILSFFTLNSYGQHKSDNQWYSNKLLRIYHPNMRNWEVNGFDVAKFVEDCAAVNAEAIVVNAGGIYSYYPSKLNIINQIQFWVVVIFLEKFVKKQRRRI